MKPEEMRWLRDKELQLYNFNNRRQLQYDTNVANALERLARCRMLMDKYQWVWNIQKDRWVCLECDASFLWNADKKEHHDSCAIAAELDDLPRGEDVKE